MKSKLKEDDTDERQPLFDRTTKSSERETHPQRQPSRLEWAGKSWTRWMHIVCWWWINPLLALAYRKTLTDDDIDDLPNAYKCPTLFNTIRNSNFRHESMSRIFLRALWKHGLWVACLRIPIVIVAITQPLLLYALILYIQERQKAGSASSVPLSTGYFYAIGLFGCLLLQALIHHYYYFFATVIDLITRNLILTTIFTQLLSSNTATLQRLTMNYVISIATNDVTKFEEYFKISTYLWEGPVEAVIIFALLSWMIGLWATLCGYIVFILLIPLQILLAQQFSQCRATVTKYTDQRIHTFEELIRGCQVIKMYHWEEHMEKRVRQTRTQELSLIRRASFLRALNLGLFLAAIPLIGYATYVGARVSGRSMKATEIFLTLAFYSQMRFPVMYALPLAIEKLTEIRLAWRRIETFIQLTAGQDQECFLQTTDGESIAQKGAITMHGASFSWDNQGDCLSLLDIHVEPGTLVGIVGTVGSGKSSLFAAILSEMFQTGGRINLNANSFSYAAQPAWIFADTLRANILFHKPYDEDRYTGVLRACCLDIDLTSMGPNGDLTVIGENGVNLSGGQRARVCLARALYADADVYLLDDPLAAVDRVVAKRIYEQCIGPRSLLKNKTRLLITHQIQFLAEAHRIITLDHGRIILQDRSSQLESASETVDQQQSEEKTPIVLAMLDIGQFSAGTQPVLVQETSKTEHVSSSLWYSLFTAPPLGSFGLFLAIILLVLGQICYDGTNLWLSRTSELAKDDQYHRSTGLIIYSVLTLTTVVLAVGRSSYCFYQILNGSNRFHNHMLSGLLYTSMGFYESNPSGRILNRVSKDQQVLDEIIPATIFDFIQFLMLTAGSVIVLVIVNPWMLVVVIVLAPAFWMLCRYYLRASQQLKRLESVNRSPIYSSFTSSLNGLATIRAFKVQDDLTRSFMNVVDANTRPYFYMAAASRWFSCRLDLMTALFTLFPAVAAITTSDAVDLSLVTLSLLYSINVVGRFQYGVRQLTEAQNFMTSAERIDEYARLPPEEDNGGSKGLIEIPTDWPDRGRIKFHTYSLCYQSNHVPTLKNINFTINAGEKVGIIGRTGAGKSSLFQGLLRLVDRSCTGGAILIDDTDISRIPLSHLRSHISVIPQRPMLLSGSVRYNLDPLDAYSDEQCWAVLETVRLKEFISGHADGLCMTVAESGSNLSAGQSQLICVARAILRQSRILLVDEATANVDNETDRYLQSLLVDIMKKQTVITIAHRLNTVTSCDRLLVLEDGRVVDFDEPGKVLHHLRVLHEHVEAIRTDFYS